MLLYLLVLAALLALLLYWFRGYLPVLRRTAQNLRGAWRLFTTLRQMAAGRAPGRGARPSQNGRVIDVTPPPPRGEVCRACGDRLSGAQVDALRRNDVRCAGASRIQRPCPYRPLN